MFKSTQNMHLNINMHACMSKYAQNIHVSIKYAFMYKYAHNIHLY